MQGLLLVDKPHGWTSFDVVNYVRKILTQAQKASLETSHADGVQGAAEKRTKSYDGTMTGVSQAATTQSAASSSRVSGSAGKQAAAMRRIKVGHTGTLDPMATGLLVLLIGKDYTRRAAEFSKLDKTYEVVARLGQTSTTGDEEGDKTAVSDTAPTEEAVRDALERFRGQIEQVPPQYSAIKINGQRAYDLARKGKIAEIEPRTVRIDRIELTKYEYPDVSFVCDISSGTYIRSLVEDIGQALGTGAYTAALRRTKVGKFDLQNAASVDNLNPEVIRQKLLYFDM